MTEFLGDLLIWDCVRTTKDSVDLPVEGDGLPFLTEGITRLTIGVESCLTVLSYTSRRSAGYWAGRVGVGLRFEGVELLLP